MQRVRDLSAHRARCALTVGSGAALLDVAEAGA